MKILLIGSFPPPLGGTALTLESLRNALELNENLTVASVNTTGIRGNGVKIPKHVFTLLLRCVIEIQKSDLVSLHIATTAMPTVGLSMALLCKLLRKPFILRKFASTDYRAGVIRGFLNHCAIRLSDLFLVETQSLVKMSQERGFQHVRWLPTHRNPPLNPLPNTSSCAKRFVFIGHVREYKGIRELVDASKLLEQCHIKIDVYGPIFSPFTLQDIKSPILEYKGVLTPENVMQTLQQYDALILPTKAPTEGYPGAIVEALTVGIPVISTQCGAIPELVGKDCGILMPFPEPRAIANAITALHDDHQLYNTLKQNVANRAVGLSTSYWAKEFIAYCESLLKKDSASSQSTDTLKDR